MASTFYVWIRRARRSSLLTVEARNVSLLPKAKVRQMAAMMQITAAAMDASDDHGWMTSNGNESNITMTPPADRMDSKVTIPMHLNVDGADYSRSESTPEIHHCATVYDEQHEASQKKGTSAAPNKPPKAKRSWSHTLLLSYQTLGVVYAGIGTCPLYVFSSFKLHEPTEHDYVAIFSIVFWTFTLISLVKYGLIILRADDQGEGGTFALYSILCKHANISRYGRVPQKMKTVDPKPESLQARTIRYLERSSSVQKLLFVVTMMGACMLIGDGILTPAISVLSAVDGLRTASSSLNQSSIVIITAVLLIALFMLQKFGTSRVGFLFSPIVVAWFVSTGLIGAYNVIVHYPGIFKALSPHYIPAFFLRRKQEGWRVLAGTVLCITSSEAMYADLGHFNRLSMQIAFALFAYPSNVMAYAGQAAYLTQHLDNQDVFYNFIPRAVFWPMFAIATLAAIVASQCLISACFSLVKQSVALDLFPKVRLVHTSKRHEGQIYSPEVNFFLMVLCVLVVLGFRDVTALGNAYGTAVIFVMFITTFFASLVMVVKWNLPIYLVLVFFTIYIFIEGVYVSAVLSKVPQGGWLPFVVAIFIGLIMYTWVYGRTKHHAYEKANMLSVDALGSWLATPDAIKRVPGLCIFYCDFENDIPPLMKHYLKNIRSLHNIIVFTTVTYTKVPWIADNERFRFSSCGGITGLYRCVALYGYAEERSLEWSVFWENLVRSLRLYLESISALPPDVLQLLPEIRNADLQVAGGYVNPAGDAHAESCLAVLAEAAQRDAGGPVLLMGRTQIVTMKKGLRYWFRKVFLDIIYRFLYSNSTSPAASLTRSVPPSDLVEISMLYTV